MTTKPAAEPSQDAFHAIVAYFDAHGINNARAGAFNILDRLKDAGLIISRAQPKSRLVQFFRGEGYSRFGWNGDEMGWSPEQTAIEAMRELMRASPPPIPNVPGGRDEIAEVLAKTIPILRLGNGKPGRRAMVVADEILRALKPQDGGK